LQSSHDVSAMNSLLNSLSDKRVDYHEVVKGISTQPFISQDMVFKFVLEYIKQYAFVQDSGSFVNENMEIAQIMSNVRHTLDFNAFM